MDILATGGLSLALGKVNLVYHQSILHLRSVMFEKVFEADQTEEAFFRRMEVSHLCSIFFQGILLFILGLGQECPTWATLRLVYLWTPRIPKPAIHESHQNIAALL